jgi:hypothetical protein
MAGELWQEHGLVFASTVGTPLNANNVIRAFRIITRKAGLGADWTPRELRHTFVSVMSASGVPVENIAQLVGHDRTATTESVYRHEIRPGAHPGCRGDGQDLRLAIFGSEPTDAPSSRRSRATGTSADAATGQARHHRSSLPDRTAYVTRWISTFIVLCHWI